jgi:hypothetical protein
VVLVAVLFGSTLFGVIGVLLAVPLAASMQVLIREILRYQGAGRRSAPRPSSAGWFFGELWNVRVPRRVRCACGCLAASAVRVGWLGVA